jgi:hypothetical protein
MEDSKRKFSRAERWVAALLGGVIAMGLWQGYAPWFFGGLFGGGHAG